MLEVGKGAGVSKDNQLLRYIWVFRYTDIHLWIYGFPYMDLWISLYRDIWIYMYVGGREGRQEYPRIISYPDIFRLRPLEKQTNLAEEGQFFHYF